MSRSEAEVAADLQSAALEHVPAIKTGVDTFGAALRATKRDPDLVATMQNTARLILAAQDLMDAARNVNETARAALAQAMVDTGCPNVRIESHTVSITEREPAPVVSDASLLPPEFLTTPAPRPDMARIKAAFAKGSVPGVVLGNGGASFVSFKSTKR